MSGDLASRLYRIFDPAKPLGEEQQDLYVDLEPVRGDGNVVNQLAKRILLPDAPTCQALAGHRGSGKSTELRRLKTELERNGLFVVYCECRTEIDYNDVDFPEVLVAIVRQLTGDLKERAGISLDPKYFQKRWKGLKKLAGSEVSLEKLELSAGFAKIQTAIGGSPDVRAEFRKALERNAGAWIDAANELIGVALLELGKQGKKGLAIIVDDLDKIITRPHEPTGGTTSEYLFINRYPQLAALGCHVVYTMPLELVYSSRGQTIANLYGGQPPVVPMTKVRKRPPARKDHKPGMEKFRELIDKRLRVAAASLSSAFESEEVRDDLVRLSGGQPSELMILFRDALVRGDLPISQQGLDWAAREGRRAYLRQLQQEHWRIIDDVRADGGLKRSREDDRPIRELLDSRAILQYVNDEVWYAENPQIGGAPNPYGSA